MWGGQDSSGGQKGKPELGFYHVHSSPSTVIHTITTSCRLLLEQTWAYFNSTVRGWVKVGRPRGPTTDDFHYFVLDGPSLVLKRSPFAAPGITVLLHCAHDGCCRSAAWDFGRRRYARAGARRPQRRRRVLWGDVEPVLLGTRCCPSGSGRRLAGGEQPGAWVAAPAGVAGQR